MREYPRRLHHKTPGWVQDGSLFHVRIRVLPTQSMALTAPELASQLLDAAQRYHDLGHWWCELFLLMPEHLHVIAAFPSEPGMSEVVRNWKRGTARFSVCNGRRAISTIACATKKKRVRRGTTFVATRS